MLYSWIMTQLKGANIIYVKSFNSSVVGVEINCKCDLLFHRFNLMMRFPCLFFYFPYSS